ncbi:MAG TPA: glycosyltransferase family 39 protein [Candidatus Eremiobacteraceae bacterium]|nr:glycosyltransferase family 39 protein [Candidatus Eremiobacteraceae bacterium]
MTHTSRYAEYAWLGLCIAIGALARLWHVTDQSPFLDEAFSLRIGAEPIGQLLRDTATLDVQPPGFYLLAHAIFSVAHWPLWQYRLLTAPLGVVTIAATWAIGRRFGVAAALVGALVVALMPGMIIWDRLFRMYSLWTALTAVSWWLLIRADEASTARPALWRFAAYASTAVALPYVHYLGAITLITQAAFAAAKPALRWPVFAACGAAAIAFAPWFAFAHTQFAAGATGFAQAPWWDAPFELFALGTPVTWTVSDVLPQCIAVAFIAAIAAGAYAVRRTAIVFWLAGIVLQAAAGALAHKDLLVSRYLFALAPAMAIAIGACVQAVLARRAAAASIAGAALLVTVESIGAQNVVLDPYYQFTDWFSVNATIRAHVAPGDAFVFVQAYPIVVVKTFSAFAGHALAGPNVPGDLPATLRWIGEQRLRRVWYVENQPDFADPGLAVRRSLRQRRQLIGVWVEPKAYAANSVDIELYGAQR